MKLLQGIVPGCSKIAVCESLKAESAESLSILLISLQGMEALIEVKVSTRSLASVIMVEPFVDEFHKFASKLPKHKMNHIYSKNENVDNKADEEAKGGSNDENEKQKANQKPPEQPKDYIHVIARSERMKLLQDIVPGSNKGMEALTEVKVTTRSLAMVIMMEPIVKEFVP
ncbi:hypothetical protein BUALT_Bualt02G0152700 [Buddleja alternifolia]|uniref:THUMP domain-containing protein n=1 Tax=Buddleja alternifolia TaxID=168488 RepID=A0AAV6Y0G1_9LAMI|nr:hypothetical protein BUALT_Bualt02G0152700 [Buddleja alternifolia]